MQLRINGLTLAVLALTGVFLASPARAQTKLLIALLKLAGARFS